MKMSVQPVGKRRLQSVTIFLIIPVEGIKVDFTNFSVPKYLNTLRLGKHQNRRLAASALAFPSRDQRLRPSQDNLLFASACSQFSFVSLPI